MNTNTDKALNIKICGFTKCYILIQIKNVKIDASKKKKNSLETNDNESTAIQNLWDAAKAALRGKFIAIQIFLKKQEKSQINNIICAVLNLLQACLTLCNPMDHSLARLHGILQARITYHLEKLEKKKQNKPSLNSAQGRKQ